MMNIKIQKNPLNIIKWNNGEYFADVLENFTCPQLVA